jgi:hypothetical protein
MKDKQQFAIEWINLWNSHDLEKILMHYTDDFEITSPMIKTATETDTSTLKGKILIKEYWQKAFEKFPDLKFEYIDAAQGVNSIVLYYKSVLNKRAMELMFFDKNNKIYKVIAHYTD